MTSLRASAVDPQHVASSGPTGFRAADELRSGGPTAAAVAGLFVQEWDGDTPGIALPRPEIHLVVRFGPSAREGLDVHAFGARQQVHRKLVRGGQRTVSARLQLGAPPAVLGVPAAALAGSVVALDELWGAAAARRLQEQLASARDLMAAAAVLERALIERTPRAGASAPVQLALGAAARLTSARVSTVASDLGVSERHLRRAFQEAFGVSPKEFATLRRFQLALHAARNQDRPARQGGRTSWASIAAAAGYYDQAHLIAEFRAIAGATPRAFLDELRAAAAVG
jgi:AraC-like DNA-binding protein